MAASLLTNINFAGFDDNGDPLVGGLLYAYQAGNHSAPLDTYTDYGAGTANANPVVLDARGEAAVWLGASPYYFVLKTAAGATIRTADNVNQPNLATLNAAAAAAATAAAALAASGGSALFSFLQSGIDAVSRTGQSKLRDSASLLDYGIVTGAGSETLNTTKLKALISPAETGGTSTYTGEIICPHGAHYYFNDLIDIKPGIHIKGNDSTFHFSKAWAAADNARGFLTFIRNVTIEDLNIDIDYDGTLGTNAGSALQIGTRGGYPYGEYTAGADDEDLVDEPQGGIVLRNVRITTNNPAARGILMLGGLDGVIMENVFINGEDVALGGIYYEFGFWHTGAAAADHLSSHARNMSFTNIHIERLVPATGAAFSLVGAYAAKISGLYFDGGGGASSVALSVRSGEALFYAMGPNDLNIKPHVEVENLNAINVGQGVSFSGAELAAGGYLAAVIAALPAAEGYAAQTDLISLSIDGFSIEATGFGLTMDGPFSLRNGSAHGTAASGQLAISDEAFPFDVENVRLTGSTNAGVRAGIGSAIWSPARLKYGEIRASTIAGNLTGVSIANSESVLISRCRIGYNTLYDPVAETTQIYGVQVTSTGKGVVADSCFVSVSAGGTPYRLEGTGPRGCALRNQRGTMSSTGSWDKNGIGFATTAEIADKTSFVNVECKWPYRMVWDTGNNRIMVTEGSTDVSPWIAADGSVVVTPV